VQHVGVTSTELNGVHDDDDDDDEGDARCDAHDDDHDNSLSISEVSSANVTLHSRSSAAHVLRVRCQQHSVLLSDVRGTFAGCGDILVSVRV
jgi:hypothetical protein